MLAEESCYINSLNTFAPLLTNNDEKKKGGGGGFHDYEKQ